MKHKRSAPTVIEVYWTEDLRLEVRPFSVKGHAPQERQDEPELEIPVGGSVRWEFTGLFEEQGTHWTPNIFFTSESPFGTLTRSPNQVEGSDNSGSPGSYRFLAVLQDNRLPRLSRIFSAPALLWQRALSVDVFVDLEQQTFKIEPLVCRIYEGASVLWRFHGLPEDYRGQLLFTEYQPEDSSQKRVVENFFGPFENISATAEGLLGSGKSGLKGQFDYQVKLTFGDFDEQSLSLREIHSRDPVVDNEKDPPAGGGGLD